ncbi:MAG: hypothetical protein WAV38_07050 [Xanthobacteraceae bacterium]
MGFVCTFSFEPSSPSSLFCLFYISSQIVRVIVIIIGVLSLLGYLVNF